MNRTVTRLSFHQSTLKQRRNLDDLERGSVLIKRCDLITVVNLETEIQELQTRVATLEAQMQVLLEHLGVGASPGDSQSDALERQVIEFIRADRVIEAVKLYREQTGLGLKEAKDAVDNLRRLHG